MPQRVGDQVLDHLLEAIGIADHLIRLRRHRRAQRDLARRAPPVSCRSMTWLEQPLEREHPHVERADTVLEPRQIDQVLDDPIEPPCLAIQGLEVALARRRVERELRHLQRFEIAAHRRQRRLQLVRHVGQHLAAQAIDGAQRLVARAPAPPPSG